jgi:Asp-tRNA(Asn)/Glu-tRNA(Gln) amidotransferase A subunit family amidase
MARDVETCEKAFAALVGGFAEVALESLEELSVAVAWTQDAAPLVRERVLEAAERFPRRRVLELPRPEGTSHLFMHEVADVHRELFDENADLYGEDVRIKIERCLQVTDSQADASASRRAEYRERVSEALEGYDLVLTPTLPCVAPRIGDGGVGDLDVREILISRTYPLNLLGWPALALPCGSAEDGLPASLQLVARPGEDGLVLAAGRFLAAVMK